MSLSNDIAIPTEALCLLELPFPVTKLIENRKKQEPLITSSDNIVKFVSDFLKDLFYFIVDIL